MKKILLVVFLLLLVVPVLADGGAYVPGQNWAWTHQKMALSPTMAPTTAPLDLTTPTGLNGSWFFKFNGDTDDFSVSWTFPLDSQNDFYLSALKAINNGDYGLTIGCQSSLPLGLACKWLKWTPSTQVMAVSDATTLFFGRMDDQVKDLGQGWGGGISVAVLNLK